jgi:hypothetical protein
MPKAGVKGSQLPVLSVKEVADLKTRIDNDEAYLEQLDKTPKDREGAAAEAHLPASQVAEVGTDAVEKRIERNKRALATMDPANMKLSGAERQRWEKRYEELKEWLSNRMITVEEQNYFPSASDHVKDQNYRKAVAHAVSADGEHSNEFISRAHEYKRLARVLWPEDPDMSNLENIRPHSHESSGRHFRK